MGSSSDEPEAVLPLVTSLFKQGRVALGKKCFSRQKSANEISQSLPESSPFKSFQKPTLTDRGHIGRSKSNAGLPDHRDEWASVLMAQGPMQDALVSLRESVGSYEKKVGIEQLGDYLGARADLTELANLAGSALEKEHLKKPGLKSLEKFSTVALEYSKLLDVVLNQSPEYASLAWGIMKFLLVANINHAKLKQNVEMNLIRIGDQLGLVNQLMYYMPTEKMVEAVALLYASFSKFLREALKCYAKSKLATVIEAFTFPWELKFEPIVKQIDQRLIHIHDLANAGHIHATLENRNLLNTLHGSHREIYQALEGNTKALREEIKEEMKREIVGLFEMFDAKWIQRFDEFLVQRARPLLSPEEQTADDYVDSFTQLALPCLKPETYLADFVSTGGRLRQFRDMTYRQLEDFDHVIYNIKLRNRHLTVYDYQQCVRLLKHEKVKAWIGTNESSILWVNTFQIFGSADWATAFATRLIDYSARFEYLTILSHFCSPRSGAHLTTTPTIIVKSLIFQVILRHRKTFVSRSKLLSLKRFRAAENDLKELWALFQDTLRCAKIDCIWIIIDSIEAIQVESPQISEDALQLLKFLNALTDDEQVTVKVFITARHAGSSKFFSAQLADDELISPRHSIITIPRGQTRAMASIWAKTSKKISRLPPENLGNVLSDAPADSISAESLLFEPESEVEDISLPNAENNITKHLKIPRKFDDHNYSDSSDSEASFLEEEPFYSSEDDDDSGGWVGVDKADKGTKINRYSSRASLTNSSGDESALNTLPGAGFSISNSENSSDVDDTPQTVKPASDIKNDQNSQNQIKAEEPFDVSDDSDDAIFN